MSVVIPQQMIRIKIEVNIKKGQQWAAPLNQLTIPIELAF